MNVINDVTEIDTNLWQGSYPHKIDPMFNWVVNLVSMTNRHHYVHHNVITTHFEDNEETIPDDEFLHSLADTINILRKTGPVLVHCEMGLNRSGLIVALVLIKSGYTPKAAIELIRQRRSPDVLFNKRFENWLLKQGPADPPTHCPVCNTKLVTAPGIAIFCPNDACEVFDAVDFYIKNKSC